jgi:GNAT superfamily N-acetyltransferase
MKPASVQILPLTPERQAGFLAYMGGAAFADNPKWQSCYCQFLYVDHRQVTWMARSAEQNRAAACQRIGQGTMQGLPAYRDGQVVGWCNAAPRLMLDAFADEPDPQAHQIGQITCFVVAKPHRRSGVATALLQAACDALKAQGLTIAEASPKPGIDDDGANHYGPMSLYLQAGFTVHRDGSHGCVHVRRRLD